MASVLLNFFRKISLLKMKITNQKKKSDMSDQLNKCESIFMEAQKIILWEDPILSCCCVVFINILFWFIFYLDMKFYGIIFTGTLVIFLGQVWTEIVSPFLNKKSTNLLSQNVKSTSKTNQSRIFTTSEMQSYVKKGQDVMKFLFVNAKIFRQSQPEMFCILTCFCFLLLSFIGQSISGFLSLYLLIMLVMIVPGACIHFLPPSVFSILSDFMYSSHEGESGEIESFLPETNPEALEVLRLAGDIELPCKEDDDLLPEYVSSQASDTTESFCSKLSFQNEQCLMPSPESSMDFLEFDLPSNEYLEQKNDTGVTISGKCFERTSSDEEDFINGLNLEDEYEEKTGIQTQSNCSTKSSLLNTENLISIGVNLLSAVANQNYNTISEKESKEASSDTDSFEMISEEDM